MKKLISVLLAAMLCMCLAAVSVSAHQMPPRDQPPVPMMQQPAPAPKKPAPAPKKPAPAPKPLRLRYPIIIEQLSD